ncbi:MAG: prephenate dehydrogenase [Deltaproteobacteria bacterium]|nr:prephenate dehydrogenase [Deltaproteobacteria bacterium]
MWTRALKQERVCVVGLGLMGGSLALAIRDDVAKLSAIEPDEGTRSQAAALGLLDDASAELGDLLGEATIVVLAAPVRTNLRLLPELPEFLAPGTLVLDVGSTKRATIAAMDELPQELLAVGGHPMCGKERAGFGAADSELFAEKTFVLCDSERTTPEAEAKAEALVGALGARPLWMDAATHDAAVATVSHLPYALSAALVAATDGLREEGQALIASGFRDTSRVAGSDPRMIADILVTNADLLLPVLARARGALDELVRRIEAEDPEALAAHLGSVQRRWHQLNRRS